MTIIDDQVRAAIPNPPSPIASRKRTGNNRVHVTLEDGTEIRILHTTPIATRYPDKTIHTRTGGWHTRTTCTAMNEVLAEWGLRTRARIVNGEITFV